MCYAEDYLEESIQRSQKYDPTAKSHLQSVRIASLTLDRQEKEKTFCHPRSQTRSQDEHHLEREVQTPQRSSEKPNGDPRERKSHEISLETQIKELQKVPKERKSHN
jgi:hypothetical protein